MSSENTAISLTEGKRTAKNMQATIKSVRIQLEIIKVCDNLGLLHICFCIFQYLIICINACLVLTW